MRRIDVAIAIVCRRERILICLRRASDRLGGFWEFPGGKVEPGETLQHCLARELIEELDIQAEPVTALTPIDHDYPDIQVRLHPFLCRHTAGEPVPLGCDQAIWIDPRTLREYRFPPANDQLIAEVVKSLSREL